MDALEHPLSAAFAVGPMATATAMTAAMLKVFAMVLCFMTNLLWLVDQVASLGSPDTNRGLKVTAYWARKV